MLATCYLSIPTYLGCHIFPLHFAGEWLVLASALLWLACQSSFCCLPRQAVWVCETWWLRYGAVVVFCNLIRSCT